MREYIDRFVVEIEYNGAESLPLPETRWAIATADVAIVPQPRVGGVDGYSAGPPRSYLCEHPLKERFRRAARRALLSISRKHGSTAGVLLGIKDQRGQLI